jgi:drug/metabolite transporter (DMT)-like permease
MSRAPLLGAFVAVVFWGLSFVATKGVIDEISPFALILLRAALGGGLLLAVLAATRQPLLPPRGLRRQVVVMGSIGVAIHGLIQAYAMTMTSAVNAGWLVALTPLWSALLAWVWLRERFSAAKIGGLAMGFAGAAWVVSGGRLDGGLLALPATRGDLLILASTVNWALYTVLGRDLLRQLGALRATCGAMVAGFVLLLPALLAPATTHGLSSLDAGGWLAVLFLGLCCSGLGYLLWYRALATVEASRVAALLYLEPLVTLAAAVALLGEPIRLSTVLGGLLLLAGVALVERAR